MNSRSFFRYHGTIKSAWLFLWDVQRLDFCWLNPRWETAHGTATREFVGGFIAPRTKVYPLVN